MDNASAPLCWPTDFRDGDALAARAFYPGLVTADLTESWDFYTTHLGFRTEREDHTHVHLVHPDGPQLTLLRHEIDGDQPELICATRGAGMWLTMEVDNADAWFVRLREAGVDASPPTKLPNGMRRVLVRDPDGVLISLVERESSINS